MKTSTRNSHSLFLSEHGFTLAEVLVSMIIFGIVSFTAIPSLIDLVRTIDKYNAQTQVLRDLRLMQFQTITQGCRGIITVNDDGSGYTFGYDYVPYDSADLPTPDVVEYTRQLPARITIAVDNTILFNSKGQIVDQPGELVSRTLSLSAVEDGTTSVFATGILYPTGAFLYE